MDELTNEMVELVSRTLKVAPDDIRPDSDLVSDLGADSLAVVELVMALEQRLGVRIEDDEAESVRTFADAVALARSKQAA